MNRKIILRLIILWFSIACLGFINGTIRDSLYLNLVGDLRAHQIATFVLSLLVFADIYLFLKNTVKNLDYSSVFLMGTVLLLFTALFEFGFGHYVLGASWSKLLESYNIFEGRVWGVFLLVQFLSPPIVKKIISRA